MVSWFVGGNRDVNGDEVGRLLTNEASSALSRIHCMRSPAETYPGFLEGGGAAMEATKKEFRPF